MTAYLVNHQKKKNILKKRVDGLKHAVKNGFSEEKIEIEAEKVRAAKLAIYKMSFSRDSALPAHDYEPSKEALEWEKKSSSEILNEFNIKKT